MSSPVIVLQAGFSAHTTTNGQTGIPQAVGKCECSTRPAQIYLDANLAMKQEALAKTTART